MQFHCQRFATEMCYGVFVFLFVNMEMRYMFGSIHVPTHTFTYTQRGSMHINDHRCTSMCMFFFAFHHVRSPSPFLTTSIYPEEIQHKVKEEVSRLFRQGIGKIRVARF